MRYLAFIFILGILACDKETIEVADQPTGTTYFPLAVGNTWVYQYDSIVYDLSMGTVLELSGFIREQITNSLADGRVEIARSWRKSPEDMWVLTDRWTAYKDEEKAVKTEENLSFIKLVFPPAKGKKWDGNSLFNQATEIVVAGEALRPYFNWQYEIVADQEIFEFNGENYSDVVRVIQVSDTSSIDLRFSEERYVDNIGLVEKNMAILDCQCLGTPASIPWSQKAEKGFYLFQRLISFNP